MAETKLKGMPVHLAGDFPKRGMMAHDFVLVKNDLSELRLSSLKGKHVVLNIFPSMDTAVCATSVRKFNRMAASMPDTVVLCISRDLPFAQSRFCVAEGIEHVITLSDFRLHSTFGRDYGVLMTEGPLSGLLARAIVVIDTEGRVSYTELVSEITQEPDYEAVMKAYFPPVAFW